MELVHGFMEIPHTDLAEVTRMELVEQDPMVMETSSVSATTRMLPVLSDASMAGTDMASLLPVLLQLICNHGG